jgi:dihydrofolate reductase
MAAHWPESDSVFAAPMNDLPKIVFSHSMTTAEWGETRIVAGDRRGVAKLKAERAGGYLLAHGDVRVARSLVSTGLIDEYRLLVHPAVLGAAGRSFPAGWTSSRSLPLRSAAAPWRTSAARPAQAPSRSGIPKRAPAAASAQMHNASARFAARRAAGLDDR